MNTFKKYCPNVFVMQTENEYNRGDITTITTKYGKEVEVEVYNIISSKENDVDLYSIVKIEDESYAERKAKRYRDSEDLHAAKSDEYYEKSKEGKDFLVLAEPIKIGHHSEKSHRALIERNYKRMANSVKESEIAEEKARKAEYWERKSKNINLSMPESLEYFKYELEEAKKYHKGLKDGSIPKEHSYSVQYANKAVKDLTKQLETAKILWG